MRLRKLKNKVNIIGEIAEESKMTNINGKSAVELLVNANGVITCYYYSDENVFEKSLPKKSLKEKKGELFYSVVSKRTFH